MDTFYYFFSLKKESHFDTEITVQKNDFAVRKVRFTQTAASQKKEAFTPTF